MKPGGQRSTVISAVTDARSCMCAKLRALRGAPGWMCKMKVCRPLRRIGRQLTEACAAALCLAADSEVRGHGAPNSQPNQISGKILARLLYTPARTASSLAPGCLFGLPTVARVRT